MTFLLTLLVLGFSSPCWSFNPVHISTVLNQGSAVARAGVKPIEIDYSMDSKSLKTSKVQKAFDKILRQSKSSRVPDFAKKFSENGVRFILDSKHFKNTSFLKATSKLQKNLSPGLDIKGSKENSINHKVNLGVDASAYKAKLAYKGYLDCNVDYQVETSAYNIVLKEDLSKDSSISFRHSSDPISKVDSQHLTYNVHW